MFLPLVLISLSSFAQSNVIDEIVWVVGDEAILRSEVEKRRLEYGNSINGNPYCMIPEQLAVQKLFLHQAAIDSIEVTDADVNPYVEQDINEKVLMAGSKEKLEEYMQMTMTQIREEIFDQYKNELTARKMRDQITSDIKVTPAEVRRFFKDVPEDSLPLIPTRRGAGAHPATPYRTGGDRPHQGIAARLCRACKYRLHIFCHTGSPLFRGPWQCPTGRRTALHGKE